MIVQVLGCNGAGKSTLVRKFMLGCDRVPHYVDGRQKPLYYRLDDRITVVGHYEIECGGADTIKYWSETIDVITKAQVRGDHVLLEGPTGREFALHSMDNVRVVWLRTPEVTCLRSVYERGSNINIDRIRRSMTRIAGIVSEYAAMGIFVDICDTRDDALDAVRTLLRRK